MSFSNFNRNHTYYEIYVVQENNNNDIKKYILKSDKNKYSNIIGTNISS